MKSIQLICLAILFFVKSPSITLAQSESPGDSIVGGNQWYTFNPLRKIALRTYSLSTRYPSLTYRMENSDGDVLERGWTSFLSFTGKAELFSRLSMGYEFEASAIRSFGLKKGYIKVSDFGIYLELGRGTYWMGHGVHGSLLLSNNGEPFTIVKFQTEKPFSIPYLGKFNYTLFNGWPQNFKILGHRLSWYPMEWLELGANQTVIYQRKYKFWEFFRILGASDSNVESVYNNDQRASLDIAVKLSFLKDYFPPFIDGKVYYEYAGEDLFAWFQKEDKIWVGPLGFEFLDIGETVGLWLRTEDQEFRLEYSQNYRNRSRFHSFIGHFGYDGYTRKWYGGPGGAWNLAFLNVGAVMGHHMGNVADDLFLDIVQQVGKGSINIFYDKERHGLISLTDWPQQVSEFPEIRHQYGIGVNYNWTGFSLKGVALMNQYKNVSLTGNVLYSVPTPRRDANESIIGLQVSISIY
ncbi:MAG: capsule assembly Wzi family protein [bacterium]